MTAFLICTSKLQYFSAREVFLFFLLKKKENYACIEEQGPIPIQTSLGSAALEPPKQGKDWGVLYVYRVFSSLRSPI